MIKLSDENKRRSRLISYELEQVSRSLLWKTSNLRSGESRELIYVIPPICIDLLVISRNKSLYLDETGS